MLEEHKQQKKKKKKRKRKKPTHSFYPVFPLFQSPQQHNTPIRQSRAHELLGHTKAILEQSEFWASQRNSRISHVLLCGTETQKWTHLCKPAPSAAARAPGWRSPHAHRKQCLVLETLLTHFFCWRMKATITLVFITRLFQEGTRWKWDAYRYVYPQPTALLLSPRPPPAKDTSRWEGCKLGCSTQQKPVARLWSHPPRSHAHTALPSSQSKGSIRELAQGLVFSLFLFVLGGVKGQEAAKWQTRLLNQHLCKSRGSV